MAVFVGVIVYQVVVFRDGWEWFVVPMGAPSLPLITVLALNIIRGIAFSDAASAEVCERKIEESGFFTVFIGCGIGLAFMHGTLWFLAT